MPTYEIVIICLSVTLIMLFLACAGVAMFVLHAWYHDSLTLSVSLAIAAIFASAVILFVVRTVNWLRSPP